MAKVWWIKREGAGRLGLMGSPDPHDVQGSAGVMHGEGVDELICLMSQHEVQEAHLEQFGECCDREGVKFKQFHLPAEGTPEIDSGFDDFLQAVARDLRSGKSVVLQCSNGRGRCAMVAGAVLALEGADAEVALKSLRAARHARAPETEEQENWLRSFVGQARPFARRIQPEPWFRQMNPLALLGAAAGLLGAIGTVNMLLRRRKSRLDRVLDGLHLPR